MQRVWKFEGMTFIKRLFNPFMMLRSRKCHFLVCLWNSLIFGCRGIRFSDIDQFFNNHRLCMLKIDNETYTLLLSCKVLLKTPHFSFFFLNTNPNLKNNAIHTSIKRPLSILPKSYIMKLTFLYATTKHCT